MVGAGLEQLVSTGGSRKLAIPAGTGALPQPINRQAGRLCRVVVTSAASAALAFYDDPEAASGDLIGYIKATAVAGDIYDFQMPATKGITAAVINGSPAVTVSFY